MVKQRLDSYLAERKLAPTRSQAESIIRLGEVMVNGKIITKSGHFVSDTDTIKVAAKDRYVSRAGLKLASVASKLHLNFEGKIVLDVGSSTGGFTDYALKHGAKKVYAIDVGTDQLHPDLQGHEQIELHEKTDIRDVYIAGSEEGKRAARRSDSLASRRDEKNRQVCLISDVPDVTLIDVSFISLREILPHIAKISDKNTFVVAMLKPQFEAGKGQVNKGVIKNDSVRRQIVKGFEAWAKYLFIVVDKADSDVTGAKGNRERFYLLKIC